MQAVILAAGRGSRMKELTESVPKPMLKVAGKTLLEHKFDALPEEVSEIIIVHGYLGEVIQKAFGDSYKNKAIRYVRQENPTGGTADALWQARPFLNKNFFVMNGDNIYARGDMKKCLQGTWAVLVQKSDSVPTGRVVVNENGFVTDIAENTAHGGEAGYINTGLYVLDTRIFNYSAIPKAPGSSELGLPQTMLQAHAEIPIRAVEATFWLEFKTPESLKEAEKVLKMADLMA